MFPNYFIFINVLSEIPNDIRMSIWSESVNLFFADPFSAFRSKLCISYYSHNIMLDYAADYGIFGFIYACILIVYLIFRIIRILYTTSNLVGPTSIILLCLAVSHFMIIFSEPPLSQRMIILLLSCLTFININDTGYRKSRRKRTSIFGIVGMDAQGRTRFKAGSRRH